MKVMMDKNKVAQLHEIASTLKSDAFIIQYHTSRGFLTPENKEKIGVSIRDIENGVQEMTELLKGI